MLTQSRCADMSTAMWDEMLRVDLRSVFLCARRSAAHAAQRWGRIISIASQLGIKGGVELSHYAAAKAGVIGFTKSLALEVAPDNVLVNAIAPGPIATPLVDGISADWKRAKEASLPLGRFGRADEVAPTAVLLASDPGGNLYVGQTLGPNGDVMPCEHPRVAAPSPSLRRGAWPATPSVRGGAAGIGPSSVSLLFGCASFAGGSIRNRRFQSCVECAVCCRAPATGARRRPDRPGDASG